MKGIGIIGAGNIGSCLTKLMCINGLDNLLVVSDKNIEKSNILIDKYNLSYSDNKNTIKMSDTIFIAVKPKNVKDVCKDINNSNSIEKKTIISTAAGVPLKKIKEWTNNKHDIIRCMPNIPISIGDGSIVWYADKFTYDMNKNFIDDIVEGPTNIWVSDESLIDAATVVSGCAPAYIAKFFEIYVNIGTEMGFTKDEAEILTKAVFSGTSKLLQNDNTSTIINNVASKGGATEIGLDKLNKDGFDKIVRDSAYETMKKIKNITKTVT